MQAMSEAPLPGISRGLPQLPGRLEIYHQSLQTRKILVRIAAAKTTQSTSGEEVLACSSAWITRATPDAALDLAQVLILPGRTCASSLLSSSSIVGDSSTVHTRTSTRALHCYGLLVIPMHVITRRLSVSSTLWTRFPTTYWLNDLPLWVDRSSRSLGRTLRVPMMRAKVSEEFALKQFPR